MQNELSDGEKTTWLVVKIVAAIFLFLLIIFNLPFVIVGAGERGVVMNWGKVQPQVLGEGLHLRIPIIQYVKTLSVRTQKSEWNEKGADSAGTLDSQRVDVNVAINWHIDPARANDIYQRVGDLEMINTAVLENNVKEAIKASTAKYVALDIQRHRDNVVDSTGILLQKKVKKYGIVIDGVALTNINFSGEFNSAVEQAQVAQQQAKRAEYQVQRVKNEAAAAIAKASGEAEAQRQVQQSLTPELLQKLAIEKWNGKFPTYMGGGTPLPFINVGQ